MILEYLLRWFGANNNSSDAVGICRELEICQLPRTLDFCQPIREIEFCE